MPFLKTTIDKDLTNEEIGQRENELLFNCKFKNVRGAMLKNCNLQHSQFLTDTLEDALGFTLTLDCHSFQNVEYSPLLFDLLLLLICKTKGNDEKRKKLVEVLGKERVVELLKLMRRIER